MQAVFTEMLSNDTSLVWIHLRFFPSFSEVLYGYKTEIIKKPFERDTMEPPLRAIPPLY